MRVARPEPSTVTSVAQVSGQSWGHAPRTIVASTSAVIGTIRKILGAKTVKTHQNHLTARLAGISFTSLPAGGPADRELLFATTSDIPGEFQMKRIATFAAMFALAACGAKTEAPKADSAAVAPAAAPAPAMAAPAMDSVKKDSTAMAAPAADTAKKM